MGLILGRGTKLPYGMAKKKKIARMESCAIFRQGSGLGALQAGGQPRRLPQSHGHHKNVVADGWGWC